MLDVAVPAEWKRQWNDFLVHFQDPFKLRVIMLSVVAAFGLLGVYRPMNTEIGILRRDLKVAQERLGMIHEIEHLRAARVKLLENFPERGEVNFWSEYLLGDIRDAGVNLRTLDSSLRKVKVGKLQGAYFDLEIAGKYDQIHKLISSIETSKYFARIVKMRFKNDGEDVEGKMSVAVLVAPQDQSKEKAATHAKSAAAQSSKPAAQKDGKPEAQKPDKSETPQAGKPEANEGAHGS